MANDNKNTNELVSEDDDPTAELEVPAFATGDAELESDARTYDVKEETASVHSAGVSVSELESDLRDRKETISRLQFDIEQLRSKWNGLESEIRARESQTKQLNDEISSLHKSLERKEKLLRKRDSRIRNLKKEIRQRDEQHRGLIGDFENLQQSLAESDEETQARAKSNLALTELSRDELISRIERSEEYADTMRHQLQDIIDAQGLVESERDKLRISLSDAEHRIDELESEVSSASIERESLREQLAKIDDRHQEELRILRFELGEAQDTVVETEQLNNQLASDLVDARNFKDELERMLGDAEEQSTARIDSLQKEVRKLVREAESYEQKINTKSEAITVLLAELAKKTEQIESIGDIEHVIHEIDDRITERIDPPGRAPVERLTRLLVGTVDGQVLRFPLFKDRLTIGRTEDNDIQLKAAYISRRHAVVQTGRDVTRIIDWGSKNGVFVNSERVKEHFLEHGDTVTIGNAQFRYEERKKRES